MVHTGLPSRGAAVGNTRKTVLGVPVPTGIKLHHFAIILGPCNSHGAEREVPHFIGSQEGQRWDS